MINLLTKRRIPSSVLGLSLQGNRIDGLVVRRTNGSLQVVKSFTCTLALHPLSSDPELVGREIKNHLEAAGIRERSCAVCLPLSWALTLQVRIPQLADEDVAGFLEIEAERGFPFSPDALSLSVSRFRSTAGEASASLVAVPRQPLLHLEKALRAAQLRPTSFTVGIPLLQPAERDAAGVIALLPGDDTVDVQVTCGGGIAVLRTIEGAVETDGAVKRIRPEVLAREIRVTLGQVPEDLRSTIRVARLFGGGDVVQRWAAELGPRLEPMGLRLEPVRAYAPGQFRSQPPADTPVTAAFSLAATLVTGVRPAFEFLPPRVSPLRQFTARFSSRKLGTVAGTAAAAVLLIGGAVSIQQWQLSGLRSEWGAMEHKVHELEEMQQQIRRFRPWFDETFPNLSILRRVTEAFPADGVVTAKTLEIHDLNSVTCTGVARDNQAFLKMLDQLRAAKELSGLKVDSVRGKTPLQFTVKFQWGHGGAGEN